MNDRRFIELLNLYVDDQLDPIEAGELETEVQNSPDRRQTYNQYCRLQRGCSLLGDSARAHAPSSQGFARSLRDAERKIAAPRRTTMWRTPYASVVATTAMAACVAVVLVVNRPSPGANPTEAMTVSQAQPVSDRVVEPISVAVVTTDEPSLPVASFDFRPVLTATGLNVARNSREAEIAAIDPEALEWMQRVELLPSRHLVVDEQAFETRPTLQQEDRVFRSRQAFRGKAEFAAFQFQR